MDPGEDAVSEPRETIVRLRDGELEALMRATLHPESDGTQRVVNVSFPNMILAQPVPRWILLRLCELRGLPLGPGQREWLAADKAAHEEKRRRTL
jgi:hypothetical protein